MSFWKMIYFRWDEKELRKWTSLKRTAYLLLPLLIYFVVHDAAEIFLVLLVQTVFGAAEAAGTLLASAEDTVRGILGALAALAGTAAVFPALKRELDAGKNACGGAKDRAPHEEKKGVDADEITAYAFLAALAVCLAAGLNIFFYQTGLIGMSQSYSEVQARQYGMHFAAGLVLYGVVSPLAEETVFRGLLYNRMRRCFGYSLALVVSSFLFGAYHGNWVQAIYGTILGLVITYTYGLYESFAAPLLFHGIANVSVYALTYKDALGGLGRRNVMILGMVMLFAAAVIFWYITKKLMGKQDAIQVARKHR